jgi:hypothetical protein
MPFIESRELRSIADKRGAAMVQMAVTNPVVISTTNTQPGTSPRSSLRNFPRVFDSKKWLTDDRAETKRRSNDKVLRSNMAAVMTA